MFISTVYFGEICIVALSCCSTSSPAGLYSGCVATADERSLCKHSFITSVVSLLSSDGNGCRKGGGVEQISCVLMI